MASYVKNFGQKFKLSSFGFTRLTDLIKAVSSVAEVSTCVNTGLRVGLGLSLGQTDATFCRNTVQHCYIARGKGNP